MQNKRIKKPPFYFHDTANNCIVVFKSPDAAGERYSMKGGTFSKNYTGLPLSFWQSSAYEQLTRKQVAKYKLTLEGN